MPQCNVVMTGLGIVSSIGIGCEEFFDALLAKRSGICSLSNRTDEGAKPGAVCEPPGMWIGAPIIDFDAKQYVRPRKALKVMCREIQTAFAASQLAVQRAGLSDCLPATEDGEVQPRDIGTVFGGEMYYGSPAEMVEAVLACRRPDGSIDPTIFGTVARREVMPLWMLKYLPNMPACQVGIALNAHGPNNSLVLGDVSGPAALVEAASCLDRGIARIMVTGASGTRINTTRMNYRADLPLSDVSDPVSDSSRPHSSDSVGVVGGEAAGAMVLESPSDAEARGANVIAHVKSYARRFVASEAIRAKYADRSDAARGSAQAIQLAISAAVADAGLSADEIGLVVSHGMGDPVIDAAERQALEQTLPGVPMTAPIASLGHTGAASGEVELIVGAMSLAKKVIPPTLHAEMSGGCFRKEPEELTKDHALCITHTSEGNAMAVVLAAN